MATVTLLEIAGLSKRFGGLQAVDDVDFHLVDGEIRAIIGPNGAGKTTLVGIISGRISPTSGKIMFGGNNITNLRGWQCVNRGIVYTFQITSIYERLTCYENVALSAQRRAMSGVFGPLALSERRIAERVEAVLLQVGLSDSRDQVAGTLSYGYQRLLEVAMGLALDPRLLILDEPTQGLAQEEILRFCDLIRTISKRSTVLLIEHNMAVVLSLAQKVTVMDKGTIIAEGTPEAIEQNSEVQRAYLGR